LDRSGVRLSESAENYLKAIYRLSRDDEFIKPKLLAEVLPYASSTITLILQRLANKGYIEYRKYRGVRLTERGRTHAARILRAHRIFEVFLYSKLDMGFSEVHVEACKAEHALSAKVIDKLDVLLGKPQRCPHGNPIPTKQLSVERMEDLSLLEAGLGRYKVSRISYETVEILSIIERLKLYPGTNIDVLKINKKRGIVLVDIDGREQLIPIYLARVVSVEKI